MKKEEKIKIPQIEISQKVIDVLTLDELKITVNLSKKLIKNHPLIKIKIS